MDLSVYEAYQAMVLFLREYARQVGQPDALVLLLNDIEAEADSVPHDPAAWSDWMDAVNRVKSEGLPYDPAALEDWLRRSGEGRQDA